MNSSRPYLVRALYEWIVDNDCTPHLLVNAEFPGVRVPPGYANDGQIVLNVSPSAVRNLHMDNEAVSFEGRFGGTAHSLYIPSGAKYVILGVRGQAVGANAYVRVVVGSTGGSTATLTGDSGFMSAAGGQLDISGEAGGWKLVQLQVVGASGYTSRINIVGVTVQWYGA